MHQPTHAVHVHNYVELCAGGGFSSIGFRQVGFTPRCAVEQQPKLADLHARLRPNVPVVTADITHDHTARLIWEHCPEPGTVMAGISCQPYSRGGLQRGGADSRAATLPATLRLTHLLQAPALVIECVTQAKTDAYVQQHVQALVQQLGYVITDCELKLEDMWSAHRHRWWLVATKASLGCVPVQPPDFTSSLVVRDVMPFVQPWSTEAD
eukprot:Skav230730  [mRNA]  locus=scaffold401:508803:509432:- [translate_table: standard]